jgi:hypothetical protein
MREIRVEGGDNVADVAVRAAAHVGPCFFVFNGIRVESDGTRSWQAMVHDCQIQAAGRQAAVNADRLARQRAAELRATEAEAALRQLPALLRVARAARRLQDDNPACPEWTEAEIELSDALAELEAVK